LVSPLTGHLEEEEEEEEEGGGDAVESCLTGHLEDVAIIWETSSSDVSEDWLKESLASEDEVYPLLQLVDGKVEDELPIVVFKGSYI